MGLIFHIYKQLTWLNIKKKKKGLKVGRRTEYTFFQRGNADAQKAHKKILNITNYQGNANQNHNDTATHTCQNVVVVVQLLSQAWLFATPWTAACQVSLSFTVTWNLFKFMSTESVTIQQSSVAHSPPAFRLSQWQSLFQWVSSW